MKQGRTGITVRWEELVHDHRGEKKVSRALNKTGEYQLQNRIHIQLQKKRGESHKQRGIKQ